MQITAPSSTTNITGLRTWTRGSSLIETVDHGTARDLAAEQRRVATRRRRRRRRRSGGGGHAFPLLMRLSARFSSSTLTERFAGEAEAPSARVLGDQPVDGRQREVTNRGDPMRLDPGVRLRDVRIQPRRARVDSIDRELRDGQARVVLGVQGQICLGVGLDRLLGREVVGAEVGERRRGGVVRRDGARRAATGSSAGRGSSPGSPSESSFGLPFLPSTTSVNCWPISLEPISLPSRWICWPLELPGKRQLPDPGDQQRVDDPERQRQHDHRDDGGDELSFESLVMSRGVRSGPGRSVRAGGRGRR